MKKDIFMKFKRSKSKVNQESSGNPYTAGSEGRQEWNDRYFNMKIQLTRWQVAFFVMSIATIILSVAAFKNASQSSIKPFVVEVCNGEPKSISPLTNSLTGEQTLIQYAVNQFIINTRTIVSDMDEEKRKLDLAYAFSTGNMLTFLGDFYKKNNPLELGAQISIQVTNVNSIKISENTWQVTWDETKRNAIGNQIIEATKWSAMITSARGEVIKRFIRENPFGIYFTQMTWNEIQH